MPGLTADIKHGGETARRILNGVRDRIQFAKQEHGRRHDKWKKDEEAALAYLPERDIDATKRLEREGGKPQYTTIVLPYSYGVLMAIHTYLTTVFLARAPVLQFTGRHGEGAQQVQAMEALQDYQVQVGGHLVPWYIWLMDSIKYGVGILGTYWEEEEHIISEIVEEEPTILGLIPARGKSKKVRQTRRIPGYHGNKSYNVRPYDFFSDPRVPMYRFQEGEFCAIYTELGWNTILRREEQGLYTNLDRIRRRGNAGSFNERESGSSQLELPASNDAFFRLGEKKSSDVTPAFEFYIDLVPDDWRLGSGKLPEKWVFTTTTDYEVVLGAQPLGAIHNKFPINILEFETEGYALAGRGIAEILDPVQRTMDWLINSHFYNVRKALNNQFVIDPSRIEMKDFQDPLPGGGIRLSEPAYGTDVNLALKQLQVQDVTRAHLSDIGEMLQIGERATGVNEQILGVSAQSSRRTATEIRTSSGFGINRLKSTAEYFSAMGWAPMSMMMVQNSQQYYNLERKFKIVGDLAQEAGQEFMNVSAEDIQGFYDFVPVDGTLPADRFAQANLWRELLNQMRQYPELSAQFDVGRIFSWVAQLAGLKNINQFKIQLAPDEQLAQQAQTGNVVPLGPGSSGSPGLGAQVPGVGSTG